MMSDESLALREYLSQEEWKQRQEEHHNRVFALTAEAQERRRQGKRHPVWDFMFSYYPISPGKMRHWFPGLGVALEMRDHTAEDMPGQSQYHRCVRRAFGSQEENKRWWTADPQLLWEKWDRKIEHIYTILSRTSQATPQFQCFGLHEWAMVFKAKPRHPEPLRLGEKKTHEFVENSGLRCTHFDAFRFFTPQAVPRNKYQLSREDQPQMEQPGCLHASMDVYKWAYKLGPIIPGELWLDSFVLACESRKIDMQASPYDLRLWGLEPIEIETKEGRAEYVRCQKRIMGEAQEMRKEIISILESYFPMLSSSDGEQRVHQPE